MKKTKKCLHVEVNVTPVGMVCARCGDVLAKSYDELVRKRMKRVKRS